MPLRLLLPLALLAALAAPTAAQDRPLDCDGAITQQAMNACAAEAYRAADAELNRVYRAVLQAAGDRHAERVRNAQRAWLAFRDAHCAVEAGTVEGGSMEPMVRDHCLADATRQRTDELRGYLAVFSL